MGDAEIPAPGEQRAQQIIEMIDAAFSRVTLGNGIGLHQAQGLDDYADERTCAALRAKDEKADWHRIDRSTLNACHSSLSFFDAEGMRFHLPAFLIASLLQDEDHATIYRLTDLSSHNLEKFKLLDLAQRGSVRCYIHHLTNSPDCRIKQKEAVQALAYWSLPTP
jgi:hypothetical protein